MAIVAGSYPGMSQIYSMRGSCSLGPFPDTAIVEFLPQASTPNANGNLTFGHGSDTITWTNAHLDFTAMQMTGNGHMTVARIQDRRAVWKFTAINGVYNERDADGELISAREKTPQQLATLLLNAIGESGYSVSALPNVSGDRPFVNWEGSNPATELQRLCRERGCDIALQHSTNTVSIVKLGTGATPVSTHQQSVSFGVDIGEVPEYLRISGAQTVFQAKLKLEPYGIDTNQEIKAADDLSYAPADGWLKYDYRLNALPDGDQADKELAQMSIGRLFKITGFSDPDAALVLPVVGTTLDAIEQIYPVNQHLIETYANAVDSKTYKKPAYISGKFVQETDDGVDGVANSADDQIYRGDFRIIPETGLVYFQKPVIKLHADNAGEFDWPDLYLTTSFSVRSNTTGEYARYTRDKNLGGTGIEIVSRDDLERTIVASYDAAAPYVIDSTTDNVTSLNTTADAYLTQLASAYASVTANHARYRGIYGLDVDGLNRQVTWQVHRETGANTWISQNSENEIGVLRSPERTRLAMLRGDLQEGDRTRKMGDRFTRQRGGRR